MRKQISIFLLIIFLFCRVHPANAFVPVAVPAWYMATTLAIGVGGAAAGYYAMTQGGASSFSTSGATRTASFTAPLLISGVPTLFTQALNAYLPFASVQSAAESNPSAYPNLHAALENPSPVPVSPSAATGILPSGTMVQVGTGQYKSLSGGGTLQAYVSCTLGSPPPAGSISGNFLFTYGACHAGPPGMYANNRPQYAAPMSPTILTSIPAPTPATPTQIVTTATGSSSGGAVLPPYQAELDRMMQNPNYVPTFTISGSGEPFTPPSGILTPEQLVAANNTAAAAATRAAATTTAAASATSAAAAATSAAAAATTAAAVAAANPGNPELQIAAANAAAFSAAASATAAEAQSAVASAEAEQAEARADTPAAVPALDVKKTFSWAKFSQLKNVMASTFPFSTLAPISQYYSVLISGNSAAPVFNLPLPLGNSIVCDLSIFDPVAIIIKWLFGILTTVGAVWYVVRFYRGVS